MSTSTPGTNPLPVAPGTVLAGKYRVQRILGQGGMGVVVEARHIALDERVALKFLLPEYATHPEASIRFQREAKAAAKLKSQHVARVSDVGKLEHGEPYMVMEFLEGSDLSKLLEQRGPFPLADAVDYTIQACEAIAEAHSHGIVHRDLKPANLFLTKNTDGTPLVKVFDFGISKAKDDSVEALTRTTAAMGSALYMSPEQMQQTRSVDHRTDIYALGVALYELLAGKQPYYAETLPQLCAEILTGTPTPLRTTRPDIPDAFAAVLAKAYARDRAMRYQTIAELVVALSPFAPPRTRSSVERVCRMAGFEPPPPGAVPMPVQAPAPAAGGDGAFYPGPYAGPQSAGAAAAFASGSNPSLAASGSNPSFSASGSNPGFAASGSNPAFAGTAPVARPSKAPVVLAVVGVGVALAAGIGFYVMRSRAPSPAAAPSASAPEAPEVASAKVDATASSPVAAPPPSAVAPPPSATSSAADAPSAPAVASATAPLTGRKPPPATTSKAKPTGTAPPATPPTSTKEKPLVPDSRE